MNRIDYVLIALMLLMTVWGYRKGLLSSAFGIAKYLVGVPAASYVSGHYYEEVYQKYLYDPLLKEVNERIAGASGIDTFVASVRTAVSKLPPDWQQQVDLSALEQANDNTIDTLIMTEVVQPFAYIVIKIVLFLGTFIIIALICSLFSAILKAKKGKHPVLTKTNHIIGGMLGLIKSILLLFLIAAAVQYIPADASLPETNIWRLLAESTLLGSLHTLLPIDHLI